MYSQTNLFVPLFFRQIHNLPELTHYASNIFEILERYYTDNALYA